MNNASILSKHDQIRIKKESNFAEDLYVEAQAYLSYFSIMHDGFCADDTSVSSLFYIRKAFYLVEAAVCSPVDCE
jgi:hypothetical protein